MPQNYVLLDSISLTVDTASVVFDNLPTSGYNDLKIVMSTRTSGVSSGTSTYQERANIVFNGSSTGYSEKWLQGEAANTVNSGNAYFGITNKGLAGTTVPSDWSTNANINASMFNNAEIYIPNYRSATTNKVWSVDCASPNNSSTRQSLMMAYCLWASNDAITSITLSPQANSWVANSTFSLYGLASVGTTPSIGPLASGGNRISTDGTYWYHEFLASGNFVPFKALTCDYLVIAGGAGGGNNYGGGGGAGGYRSTVGTSGGGASAETALSLSTDVRYIVQVGAGGVGVEGNAGNNGTASIFSTITTVGGGTGGGPGINGTEGGSGGGAGGASSGSGGGGAGTTNQGFAGGGRFGQAAVGPAGGGGGAGSAGTNATSSQGGAGGNGVSSSITGTAVTRAGGGGGGVITGTGGAAGTGGAGAGVSGNNKGGNAVTNTGSGGGGGGEGAAARGGNGASGIVIVRYLANS
jgi:hypothetical protein